MKSNLRNRPADILPVHGAERFPLRAGTLIFVTYIIPYILTKSRNLIFAVISGGENFLRIFSQCDNIVMNPALYCGRKLSGYFFLSCIHLPMT